MRILRPALAALVLLALVASGTPAEADPPSFVVTLSASSGPSTATITATYVYLPAAPILDPTCVFLTLTHPSIVFKWDGHTLGTVAVTRGSDPAGQANCVAHLSFHPPTGLSGAGRHTVLAEFSDGAEEDTTTFTITGGGSGSSPAAHPTPTMAATHATPTRQATKSSVPLTSSTAADASPIDSLILSPSPPSSAAVQGLSAVSDNHTDHTGVSVAVAAAGLLILGGASILLIRRSRANRA
jgi:hypothetical protein